MKKAKIFLTALTVLTVVGGALAFKARQPHVFYTCDTSKDLCIIPFITTTETTTNVGTEKRFYDKFEAPCDANDQCTTLVTTAG